MKTRSWVRWVVAAVLALAVSAHQRRTGPTSAVHGKVDVEGTKVAFDLDRSYTNAKDAEMRIKVPDTGISGALEFRRHPSPDSWTRQELRREGDSLVGQVPRQPAAGKVMCQISLSKNVTAPVWLTREPIVIRFHNDVPFFPVVVPHVFVLVAAMVLAGRAALEAWAKGPRTFLLSLLTVISLTVGGLIFGPIMQKYAFGEYWTGWPFGQDLTDNKTAAALLVWLVALWRLRAKPPARGWVMAAALVMLAVYLIPHSVLGSELDYSQVPAP